MSARRHKAERQAARAKAMEAAPPALPSAPGAEDMARRQAFRVPDWAKAPPRRKRVALVPLTLQPPTGGTP